MESYILFAALIFVPTDKLMNENGIKNATRLRFLNIPMGFYSSGNDWQVLYSKYHEELELVRSFFASPWKIRRKDQVTLGKAILGLLFKEKLHYTNNRECRKQKTFIVQRFSDKCEMVLQERIELSTSSLPMRCSTTELLQLI